MLFLSTLLAQAQGSKDECVTSPFGDLFEGGFEYGLDIWIFPAVAGAVKLFAPDPSSNSGATDPAHGIVVNPQADPGKERTNSLPGISEQIDLELQVIGNPDAECDHL